MTENPYEAPSTYAAPPSKCIKKANNLIRDARLAFVVALIPLLGLIYILRLVQWYQLRKELAELDKEEHAKLLKDFRSAWSSLWFAILFWPRLARIIHEPVSVLHNMNAEKESRLSCPEHRAD